jgi:hypothetical protein
MFELSALVNGFWSPKNLDTSTIETNFRMGHPTFSSRESAEAHRAEMVAVGWDPARLRVVEADACEACQVCGNGVPLNGPSTRTDWYVCADCLADGYTSAPGQDVARAVAT